MVRSVNVELLTENIKEMCIQANHFLAPAQAVEHVV